MEPIAETAAGGALGFGGRHAVADRVLVDAGGDVEGLFIVEIVVELFAAEDVGEA